MPNDDKNNNNRGKMSVSEAGHKGGERTAQTHDREFYQEIGHKGGEATSESHGREFYQEIGHKGGEASPGKFAPGSERAREAGRKGGEARGDARREQDELE